MKILHTSDWHLGHRSGRIDRTPDLRRAVQEVATICDAEQVEVLLLCGDIFSELNRTETLKNWVEFLSLTFGPFLRGGGTILALIGNHDSETFSQMLREAMTLAAPGVDSPGALLDAGRFYLFVGPTFFRLRDKAGDMTQFVMMPFPTPSRYLTDVSSQSYKSLDERNAAMKQAFSAAIARIFADMQFDTSTQTVLAAHILTAGADIRAGVRGAPVSGEVSQGLVVAESDFPPQLAYVALGDVHKPQVLGGRAHVRYCGSIERLDLGESADAKEVVLIDVGPAGLRTPPKSLPLNATPIYRVEIDDPPTQMATLVERYPDHERALVKLVVRYRAGRDDVNAILAELDRVFPRWYDREWIEASAGEGPAAPTGLTAGKPFEETVREYLAAQLATDAEKEAILALADELMKEL